MGQYQIKTELLLLPLVEQFLVLIRLFFLNSFAPAKQSSNYLHEKNININCLYFYRSLVLGHWLLYQLCYVAEKEI